MLEAGEGVLVRDAERPPGRDQLFDPPQEDGRSAAEGRVFVKPVLGVLDRLVDDDEPLVQVVVDAQGRHQGLTWIAASAASRGPFSSSRLPDPTSGRPLSVSRQSSATTRPLSRQT